MISWATRTAIAGARATIAAAFQTIDTIRDAAKPSGQVSIQSRQASELARFLNAYTQELKQVTDFAEQNPSESFRLKSMVVRETELDEALTFVNSAFLSPRMNSQTQQILEAADWMCVEIWQRFISQENGPIGPIVAIDARRSPAVWVADALLPMPSFFRSEPGYVKRGPAKDVRDRPMAYFPVICLPAAVTRMPEYLPLLAHEVGHAVDDACRLIEQVLTRLSTSAHQEYWQAWMREILADFIGVAVSGEAFAMALYGYVRGLSVSETITTSSAYPGMSLRLAFLADIVRGFGRPQSPVVELLTPVRSLGPTGKELLAEFCNIVLPVLADVCEVNPNAWCHTQEQIDSLAASTLTARGQTEIPNQLSGIPFCLLPSIITVAGYSEPSFNAQESFRWLHAAKSAAGGPDWIQTAANWQFSMQTLPALRPTIVAANGQTKIPPEDLLVHFNHIAFVGATNGQLAKQIETAFARRKAPWNSLEFYFLNDAELDKVERDTEFPMSRQQLTEMLIIERNDAIAALRTLRNTLKLATSMSGYLVADSRMLFGAWFDWHEPGGRVHVSSQLLGTDLRRCPSQDFVWQNSSAAPAYVRYVRHLEELRKRSTPLTFDGCSTAYQNSPGAP